MTSERAAEKGCRESNRLQKQPVVAVTIVAYASGAVTTRQRVDADKSVIGLGLTIYGEVNQGERGEASWYHVGRVFGEHPPGRAG